MNDTICAIATGAAGGIGILRISGDRCKDIALQVLKVKLKPRYAYYGSFYDNDNKIDQGIAIYFPAPNSFTGEDVLELQAHGGNIVMQMLLTAVVNCGVRIAEAGEFSKRAFLNGKIDLLQAEAIADIISADSKYAVNLALRSLDGDFSKQINTLNKHITDIRVFVEAAIDFVEEDIEFIDNYDISKKITIIKQQLSNILAGCKQGALLKNGIYIAIIGSVNVGKSSLLNILTQKDSAIVTDIAGTTRDVIKEHITINNIPINIIDTAGFRESNDAVEKEGIRRSKLELQKADVVLFVFDNKTKLDFSVLDNIKAKIILVQNKIDIMTEQINTNYPLVSISAKKNIGIQELKDKIISIIGIYNNTENINLARTRHIVALKDSLAFIKEAKTELNNENFELLAENLNQSAKCLGRITGKISSDDLLGKIFASFCVGK